MVEKKYVLVFKKTFRNSWVHLHVSLGIIPRYFLFSSLFEPWDSSKKSYFLKKLNAFECRVV